MKVWITADKDGDKRLFEIYIHWINKMTINN